MKYTLKYYFKIFLKYIRTILQNNLDARISRDGLRALNVFRCVCNFVC